MHSPEQIMEAIDRLEATLYGDPSRDKKGLVERVNSTEAYVSEIRGDLKKIIWLLVAGVFGAGLNLVLNTKNMQANHSSPPPSSAQAK